MNMLALNDRLGPLSNRREASPRVLRHAGHRVRKHNKSVRRVLLVVLLHLHRESHHARDLQAVRRKPTGTPSA